MPKLEKLIIPYRIHIRQSRFVLLVLIILRKVLRNYIWQSASFKKVATLNTVTSLTAKSVMDIFLQVLQNFQNTAVLKKNLQEHILSMSKSELMSS